MTGQVNCAEAMDRMQKGVAWGMLICGLTYVALLIEELTPMGTVNQALDVISSLGVIVTMAVILIALWPIIRMKMKGQFGTAREPESFFSNAMLMSFKNSWIVSMVTVILLLGVSTQLEQFELSHKFFFTLIFAVSVLSASLSFFWQTRKDDLDDMEE